ncbi:amidase [Bradyrhizobium cenepequi]
MSFTPEQARRSAFVEHGLSSLRMASDGPLAGLTFAVKDLFDVKGFKSGWGNPDRLREASEAVATAPAVLVPLMAGAEMVGKTHTDEIACGMFGMNPHFGTPLNSAAPGRVPGGSSSGSASAVAAGLCDFALGTDTGGSIRVPASFCGLFGLRTTFGRISTAGVMPMAPSFDTVGLLTRDAGTMRRVADCYFGPAEQRIAPRLLLARDAFEIPVQAVGETLLAVAQSMEPARETRLFAGGVDLWLDTFRPLQLHDLWATFGAWGRMPNRTLSPMVAQRLDLAATVDPAKLAEAVVQRERLMDALVETLGDDGVIVLPTAHDLPPLLEAPLSKQVEFRERTLALTCVASLCRLPQINIPAAVVDGCPAGLSLIAGPRKEHLLLDVAEQLAARTS